MIVNISAVTLAVRDMARSVAFYEKLGFEVVYGSRRSGFTSLRNRKFGNGPLFEVLHPGNQC